MVVFTYNVGEENFATSSLLKAHNRGDHQSAGRAFGLYNKAHVNGVLTVLKGLTARRSAESALYFEPVQTEEIVMPQAVTPESLLIHSPTIQANSVAGITSVIAATSEVSTQVDQISSTASKHMRTGIGAH